MQLDADGWAIREITEEMGVSRESIHRILKSYRVTGEQIPL